MIERRWEDLLTPGETKRKYNIGPYLVPSAYVFSYLLRSGQPKLVDDTGKPIWTRSGNENIVVYAEPPDCQTTNRVSYLNNLFTPALDLNYTQVIDADPPDDSGVAIGVPKADLLALYEREQPGSTCGKGGQAINYLPVLVYDPLPLSSDTPSNGSPGAL